MVTVLLWALFLAVAEGYGVGGRGSCEHRGKRIPFGVVQTFDNCEYCVCSVGGNVQCQNFVTSDCSQFDTDCDAPFTPFGECCPRCHSETEPEFAHYSGFGNNVANPMAGSVGSKLVRLSPPQYGDGFGTPREYGVGGGLLTNAREISNVLGDTDGNPELNNPQPGPEDSRGLTCWFWQWGQFIDHDFTLVTEVTDAHAEEFGIPVPTGDVYQPDTTELHFARANWDRNTGTGPGNWRGHVNSISTAIDGSNVYGSDAYTNYLLRGGASSANGRFKVHSELDSEQGELLPLNNGDGGVGINMAAMDAAADHFAAGDFRANEQQLLATIHTLWVREHNRWAGVLKGEHPTWGDERLFQEARKFVRAEMQIITYDEWLPAVLGTSLQPYGGYQPNIPMAMSTEFVGAFFRFGHTAIRDGYAHIAADGSVSGFSLRDLFFDSAPFLQNGFSVAGFARGLSQCRAQEIDTKLVDALRLHLFDGVGDLLALNVQRARDMGIGGINEIRKALSLAPHATWADVTSDPAIQAQLAIVYSSVDDCDAWICGMAENKKYGSVGETLGTVLIDQFARLRDGDRFWWQNALSRAEQRRVKDFRLADLLENNGVAGTKAKAGPNLQTLFLARNNDHFAAADLTDVACTDMTPASCPYSNAFSYPQDVNQDGTCQVDGATAYQPCLCNLCGGTDPRWGTGTVCGSDALNYDSECDLIEAACKRTNLQMAHLGSCFAEENRITLDVGSDGVIYVPLSGVPPRLVIEVKRLSGAQDWEVHLVTNCDTMARLNPTASPEAPVPSVMPTKTASCDDTGCILRGRLMMGTRVATDDVKFLQTMECESDDSIHIGGLLGSSILIKPEGKADTHSKAECHVITGAPFVQMEAELTRLTGNNRRIANIQISGDINGAGPANVQIVTRRRANQNNNEFAASTYSFYLTNEACDQTSWTHFNYGQDAHGETPPLMSFSIDQALYHEDTYLGVNPYLHVVGKNTPLNRYVRVVDHVDSSVLACGKVELVHDYDETDCLFDNTANGGRGQSLYRSFRQSGGFSVNLADSEQQTQGSTQNTNASDQQTFGGGGMASGTGILMIMVALVVVLLIALIFVVIVLYVRSNPYTAPSALKKVGSLAGDPRPSAQVVN